jgi:hypothetical protein
MIKDRILIDGVWYRREAELAKRELEVTFARTCSLETNNYCWEASRLQRGKDEAQGYWPGIDIKFTDKTERPWTEEHWDSEAWFRGVLTGTPESLEHAEETMSPAGQADFRRFLENLVELGWLTVEEHGEGKY